MTRRTQLQIAVVVAILVASALSAGAGELRLRGEVQVESSVVRLGDVAELIGISNDESRELAALPLFPVPKAGLSRRVTAQDVRDTMSLYGFSLPTLAVVGEARVSAATAAQGTLDIAPSSGDAAVDDAELAALRETLTKAILNHLQSKSRTPRHWKVSLELTAEQAKVLAAMQELEVSGGQSPGTGHQVFQLRDRAAADSKPLAFKADVSRFAAAVVATRQLPRGEVIGPADVKLAQVNPVSLSAESLSDLNQALGQEVTRSMSEGQIVSANALRRPLAIRRGELVTVYSLAAGVQVKARAKALADGALGDVVLLQSTESEKRFQARVTGPQEAMVFVDAPQVAAESGTEQSVYK